MHPDTLRQLVANCRRKASRGYGFPRDWNPGAVRAPSGLCFTEAGAWDFIADYLDAGGAYEQIVLDQPLGGIGIVIKTQMRADSQVVYIKLELGPSNKPLARSFHYSDRF